MIAHNALTRCGFALTIVLIVSCAARAQRRDDSTADVLRRAVSYQFQFRAGQVDIVGEYVAMLEAATMSHPEDADLWDAMGLAYLAQAARALMPGGRPADAIAAMTKGPAALERALRLNPEHAGAMATHGGVQAFMGLYQNAPAASANGVAAMNRAVALAPSSRRVRLQRAFSGINLPDAMRNRSAEAEDLEFLITVSDGTRAGGYIRLLRGDLYAEAGVTDLARVQYRFVAESSSPAAAGAQARLVALDQGGVPDAEIKKLRQAAGTNCLMCHGK